MEQRIEDLKELAYNLWWTWNQNAQSLFKEFSPQVWEESNHNAVAVYHSLSHDELRARLRESSLTARVDQVLIEFHAYMRPERTWAASHAAQFIDQPIAYFSPEFAVHESLPIYSGGLGVLSGDHVKSSSDLGLSLIGIGLFYRQGYFHQTVTPDGHQVEHYPLNDPKDLPITLLSDKAGKPVVTVVEIGHSIVSLYAWKLNVGRITLYLLDSNHPDNEEHYRELTSRTYGGDISTRICQEVAMGIGGARLLKTLNIDPSVYHLNEGHSAFLTLELARNKMLEGSSFDEALIWVKDQCVFTTHTPVPAGHDRFTKELMHFTLDNYSAVLGIPVDRIMQLGRVVPSDDKETFCMTVCALNLSRISNAVSLLHEDVTHKMWQPLYPDKPVADVPIIHITNGVHILGWMTERTRHFWKKFLGEDWESHIMKPDFWQRATDPGFISDDEIWALRYDLRRSLIEFVRGRLREQQRRFGGNGLKSYASYLSPDALTIGFARRFASYKRAPMIFHDLERAIKLFGNPERPVQIVFSGKSHPKDDSGKAFIKRIVELTKHPQFYGKIAFVENYDMNVARHLVSGCDVWLNNPRRPLEASGTSGQKIGVHGGLNLSILDGWWREAYDGSNGFAIGPDTHVDDEKEQDRIDEENLYTILENEVIPLFYNRDESNVPRMWIQRIRRAMQTLVPTFNTDRMVADYVKKMYHRTGSRT